MSIDINSLVRINKDNAKPAVETLVSAFNDYPLFQHYFPDKNNRTQLLHSLLSLPVYSGIRYGEVYATSPRFEGVAVWIPSNHYPITTWKVLRTVPLMAIFCLGRYGGPKMKQFGAHIDDVHQRLAPFKHWFLQAIGIDPKYQGMGYASKLIRTMLSEIDKEHLPCYLETLDEKNVLVYEHFGFKTINKSEVPKTAFTSWAMLREAH